MGCGLIDAVSEGLCLLTFAPFISLSACLIILTVFPWSIPRRCCRRLQCQGGWPRRATAIITKRRLRYRRTVQHPIRNSSVKKMAPKNQQAGAFTRRYAAIGTLTHLPGLGEDDSPTNLEELVAERAALQKELDEILRSPSFNQDIQAKIDEASESQIRRMDAVFGQLGWVAREVDRKKLEIADAATLNARQELEAEQEKSAELQVEADKVPGLAEEVKRLNGALGRANGQITGLQEERNGLRMQVENLESERDESKKQVTELQEAEKALEGEVAKLKDDVDRTSKRLQEQAEGAKSSWIAHEKDRALQKQKADLDRDRQDALDEAGDNQEAALRQQREELEKAHQKALDEAEQRYARDIATRDEQWQSVLDREVQAKDIELEEQSWAAGLDLEEQREALMDQMVKKSAAQRRRMQEECAELQLQIDVREQTIGELRKMQKEDKEEYREEAGWMQQQLEDQSEAHLGDLERAAQEHTEVVADAEHEALVERTAAREERRKLIRRMVRMVIVLEARLRMKTMLANSALNAAEVFRTDFESSLRAQFQQAGLEWRPLEDDD